MAMVAEREFSCWELKILQPAVKRLHYVYQVLHRTVDKFKEDIKKLPREFDKQLKQFYEIEDCPKLFVFSKRCAEEEELQKLLIDCGMIKKRSDVSLEVLIQHKDVRDKLEQAVAKHIPMAALVLVNDDDILERQILPRSFLGDLKENTRKTILSNLVLLLHMKLTSHADMNEKIADLIKMEASLNEVGEPFGSRVLHTGDKMLPGIISRMIERIVGKRIEHFVHLIEKATSISPKSLLEQEIHISFIWDITALKVRANQFRLPEYKVTRVTTDNAGRRGSEVKFYGREILWDLVRFVREDVFKNNTWIWDDLEQLSSEHDGCQILRFPMKEHFQSYIDGMIIGAVPISNTALLCARANPNSPQFRACLADCMIQILTKQKEFISSEIKEEVKQKARSLLDLQHVLQNWKSDLTNCHTRCSLPDDIPFEVQLGLSRVPEVRTYGIWNNKFHIAVTPPVDHSKLLPTLQRAVGNYKIIDGSMVVPYKKPVPHFMSGNQINQQQTRVGMITMFVTNENESTIRNLYCLTCKHVVPQHLGPVYVVECRGCQGTCICPKEEFGVNTYSFGAEKESIHGGLVDISCVKVHDRHVPACDFNIRGCKSKLAHTQDFQGTLEDNVGKQVFKWDSSNENRHEGVYSGVAYIRPSELNMVDSQSEPDLGTMFPDPARKVDLIRSSQVFGRPGESGALVCIQECRLQTSDIISPAFVYLGKWEQNEDMYMCFRLQEGLDCLYSEYNIHLSQHTSNDCEKPRTLVSGRRKRRKSRSS